MVLCVHTHHQWDHGNGMLTCIQELVNMNLTLLWNLLYDKLNYAHCWLALIYDQLEYRLIPQWITINNILLFYHMKQIESMLLWVCTVIHNVSGREIAPNTGANAPKFFTLATKSWKLVAKLVTRTFHHNLTKRYSELKRFAKINPRQTSSLSLFPKCSTCISIDN